VGVTQQGAPAPALSRLQLVCSAELSSEDLCRFHSAVLGKAGTAEDEVLFDAELASYISDTDYTELRGADVEVSGAACCYSLACVHLRSHPQWC
jgi:hypothetical protein